MPTIEGVSHDTAQWVAEASWKGKMPGGRSKSGRKQKRLVWRISDAAPLGEFVDASLPAAPPPERPSAEPTHPGWAMSTFELLHGVEISEEDPSTVPAELIDELFKKKPPG